METTDPLYAYIYSADFRHLMQTFAWVSLLLAVGFALLTLALYVRDRDRPGSSEIDAPWGMLIATLRDTFIITMLYVSDGLLWKFSTFQQSSETLPTKPWLYAPVVEPLLSFFVHLLIFAVALQRVLALGHWLRRNSPD